MIRKIKQDEIRSSSNGRSEKKIIRIIKIKQKKTRQKNQSRK